jgi:hypothetical protein
MLLVYVEEFIKINLLNHLVKIKNLWKKLLNGIEEVLLRIQIFSTTEKKLKSFVLLIYDFSAGINLLFLLAVKTEDLKKNNEAYRISRLFEIIKI